MEGWRARACGKGERARASTERGCFDLARRARRLSLNEEAKTRRKRKARVDRRLLDASTGVRRAGAIARKRAREGRLSSIAPLQKNALSLTRRVGSGSTDFLGDGHGWRERGECVVVVSVARNE